MPSLLRLPPCHAGNVAVEFGLAAPVLLLMMLASAEVGRFVLLHQKVDRVATTVSDLVSRAETISESQLDVIFTAAGQVAALFNLADLGLVLVTSIANPSGDGKGSIIVWQRLLLEDQPARRRGRRGRASGRLRRA